MMKIDAVTSHVLSAHGASCVHQAKELFGLTTVEKVRVQKLSDPIHLVYDYCVIMVESSDEDIQIMFYLTDKIAQRGCTSVAQNYAALKNETALANVSGVGAESVALLAGVRAAATLAVKRQSPTQAIA